MHGTEGRRSPHEKTSCLQWQKSCKFENRIRKYTFPDILTYPMLLTSTQREAGQQRIQELVQEVVVLLLRFVQSIGVYINGI